MDFAAIDALIARSGAGRVVEATAPFLTDARRRRIEAVLGARLPDVRVACEHPEDPHNAAAVVRSAEALGLLHVHVVDAPSGALHARGVTQGAFRWVQTHHHPHLEELFRSLGSGCRVFGADMEGSLALDQLPTEGPICLLFGNEGEGLSAAARARVDGTFRVPMFGMSESLNLSVSAAISLYAVTRARRERSAATLRGGAYLRQKARYYAASVEVRLLEALLAAR